MDETLLTSVHPCKFPKYYRTRHITGQVPTYYLNKQQKINSTKFGTPQTPYTHIHHHIIHTKKKKVFWKNMSYYFCSCVFLTIKPSSSSKMKYRLSLTTRIEPTIFHFTHFFVHAPRVSEHLLRLSLQYANEKIWHRRISASITDPPMKWEKYSTEKYFTSKQTRH